MEKNATAEIVIFKILNSETIIILNEDLLLSGIIKKA